MSPAYPKPGKKLRPPVKVFPDGREQCDLKTKLGQDDYSRRKRAMWERQKGRCSLMITTLCKLMQGKLPFSECTFEHSAGRGAGKRDDRIEKLNPETGKMEPINSVACSWCNNEKGSRPLSAVLADVVP